MRLLLIACLLAVACTVDAAAFSSTVVNIEVSTKKSTKIYVAKSIKMDERGNYQIEDFCNPGQIQTITFSQSQDNDERIYLTIYAEEQGRQVCENKHKLER